MALLSTISAEGLSDWIWLLIFSVFMCYIGSLLRDIVGRPHRGIYLKGPLTLPYVQPRQTATEHVRLFRPAPFDWQKDPEL